MIKIIEGKYDSKKQFDENGNFINPPKPEIMEETEVDSYFTSSVKVIYDFLKIKNN
jgi:hypothetical protein